MERLQALSIDQHGLPHCPFDTLSSETQRVDRLSTGLLEVFSTFDVSMLQWLSLVQPSALTIPSSSPSVMVDCLCNLGLSVHSCEECWDSLTWFFSFFCRSATNGDSKSCSGLIGSGVLLGGSGGSMDDSI